MKNTAQYTHTTYGLGYAVAEADVKSLGLTRAIRKVNPAAKLLAGLLERLSGWLESAAEAVSELAWKLSRGRIVGYEPAEDAASRMVAVMNSQLGDSLFNSQINAYANAVTQKDAES